MVPLSQIFGLLLLCVPGSSAQIVLTQADRVLSASPGERISVSCRASESLLYSDGKHYLSWYQFKPGKAPVGLLYHASTLFSGVSSRFSGSGSGTDFTLTITNMEPGDYAEYYCLQTLKSPYTVVDGTKVEIKRSNAQPTVFLFPPSEEQLKTGSVTVVCNINGFYPKDINVKWKVDNNEYTRDIMNSLRDQDSKDSTYSLSSFLTMPSSEYQSHNEFICEVKHASMTSPLSKSFNR
ncbi:immunoglobulin kappa light chain-like [Suncus etruscus]|uniref:immunoglobulin kappa light chain-like n=1 Tax=Suncus etruscus TaxID=109475 RepID=UPI00210FFD9F|nr:immunoglobulin kappa light chain-like [Suncus etruscus]